jgi:hypothetical protein
MRGLLVHEGDLTGVAAWEGEKEEGMWEEEGR